MAAHRPMNTTTTRLRSRAASLATACALVATILAVGPTAPPAVAVSGAELIVTAAGGGADGRNDGGAATSTKLSLPWGLAVGGSGDLYIVGDAFVRRVDASGVITTVAGNGGYGFSGDGGPATAAQMEPLDVTVHADGSLYIGDFSRRVRRVAPGADGVVNGGADEIITTVAGNGSYESSGDGDGGPATEAGGVEGWGVTTDGAGNLFLSSGNRVRKVVPGPDGVVNGGAGETITTVAGTGTAGSSGDGGPATDATLWVPKGLAADSVGNLFIADSNNNRVRRVDAGGTITTVAGTGAKGFSGDGGRAVEALLNAPWDVALDASGNLYIAERLGSRVRKVDASGVITTVAGTGIRGYSGDGGPASEARLGSPYGVAVDPAGALYVADAYLADAMGTHRVRRVGPDLLGLAMADSADPVATGGELTYTLTVRNYASSPASATRVRDTLPSGASFRSATPSQGACAEAGGTVTCELGTLAPRATATVSIVVAAPSAPTPAGTPMENRATVSAGEADPFPQDNLATSRTTVIVPADVSVRVADSPDPVGVNQPLTYTFTVANAGPGPATQVKLINPLPESVRILQMGASSPGGCSEYWIDRGGYGTREGVQCSWPSLAPGATGTGWVQIAAPSESTTTGVESTVFTSTATVSAAEPDADTTNNVDSEDTVVATTARPAGLGVAVEDSPDPVQEGQRLVYTLTVANALPLEATATAVSLTDTLASAVTFRSATPSQGVCSPPPPSPTGPSGGTVTCALGAMGPGATATVAIEVSADADGDHPNVATVSAVEAPDPSTAVAITRVSDRDCGQSIERDYTLAADIGPCAGNGLVVAADNLTVDLGGHHLFGFPGPSDGKAAGVRVQGRSGVTVTNRHPDRPGIVSGFDAGVLLQGGGGHTVADIVATANVGPGTLTNPDLGDGIAVIRSANNHIVGNTVVGNGQYDNIGVLGHQADGNTIEANTIETMVNTTEGKPGPGGGPVFNMQGIVVSARLDDSDKGLAISNTTIKNNTVRGHTGGAGISNLNSVDGTIVANLVEGNRRGIGVAVGFEFSSPTRMLVADNTLVDNAGYGIELLSGARDNLATNNRVVHKNGSSEDLMDKNPKCGSNSWVANTSGLGTYSPECVGTPPPDTRFVSGPAGPTNDDTPTFEFAASIDGSDFFCRVDDADFAPCTSPYTTLALALGAHTFQVKARGPVGNSDPTPAVRSFVVEPPARPAVADFDANGASDIAVFRAGSGSWFPQGGTDAYWGTEGDLAVPGDYDGVAGTEMAVFRPSTGTWFVKDGQTTAWGTEGDLPVPGDYDGDKKADIAVFRPSTGAWYIRPSGGGAEQSVGWGTTGDIPVPGDYNGDGTTEIAVFRPSSGTWYVLGGPTTNWGTEGDIPVPGDYDGSGDTDMAVFRPSSATWFVEGGATLAWGTEGDIPVPGDFDGNASADIAVFRPSTGTWYVNGGATTNWGTAGDQPLPLPPAIRQSF